MPKVLTDVSVDYELGMLTFDDGVERVNVMRGPIVSAREWKAVPGDNDVSTEIQKAFDECPSYGTLIFEPGTYKISDSVVLDNSINVIADGVLFDLETNVPTATIATGIPENHDGTSYLNIAQRQAGTLEDKVAVYFKGTGAGRLYRNYIRGLRVKRTASDNKQGTRLYLGIVIEGAFECLFEDLYVEDFFGGIVCIGLPAGGGFAHNRCNAFSSRECRYGLTLYSSDSGYANQNIFVGGRHQLSAAIRGDSEWTANKGVEWEYLRILWESTSTVSSPNGNEFYGMTLEEQVGRKLRLEGSDNQFLNCRWEGYRTSAPLTDITIGEASRLATNFARNKIRYGSQLQNIVGLGQFEFLSSGGASNIGNSLVSGGPNIYGGVASGSQNTAHIFQNGNATFPVIAIANATMQQLVKGYHVYASLSAQGAFEFLDTGGTIRNAIGMNTASPYDFRTLAGLNIGNVLRARVSTNDVLIANPSGGHYILNVAAGTFRFYSGSSSNNDVVTIADSSQVIRIVLKAAAAAGDWGAGHYGVMEFYNATPAKENAIMLGSTAFGSTRPIAIYGPVWFNKGATASFGRYRGSSLTSLMEWDCVNDRVGVNTTAPDRLFHVNGEVHVGSHLEIDGDFNHDGANYGFCGATPSSRPTYTPTNVTTDRAFDADSTTIDEIADVLGTLIADLQTKGLLQ